jgi:uncharacterized membrane protein
MTSNEHYNFAHKTYGDTVQTHVIVVSIPLTLLTEGAAVVLVVVVVVVVVKPVISKSSQHC